MPRPKKTNIDYFPLYCCYDERIALAEAEQGIEAFYIYIKLLMRIYGGKGYYLEWAKKNEILFANENHIDIDKVHDVVETLIMYDLFSKEIYDNYSILTSKEIQEHYLYAVSRRKIDQLDQRLVLVNVTETQVNVTETQVNVTETPINVAESTQIKENKRKEKNIKEKESRGGYHPPVPSTAIPILTPTPRGEMNNVILTDFEYEQLKTKYPDIDALIDRFSIYMASTGKSYSSHYATLIRWAEEDITRGSIAPVYNPYTPKQQINTKATSPERGSSFDIDEFFAAALKHSDEKMLQKRSVSLPECKKR